MHGSRNEATCSCVVVLSQIGNGPRQTCTKLHHQRPQFFFFAVRFTPHCLFSLFFSLRGWGLIFFFFCFVRVTLAAVSRAFLCCLFADKGSRRPRWHQRKGRESAAGNAISLLSRCCPSASLSLFLCIVRAIAQVVFASPRRFFHILAGHLFSHSSVARCSLRWLKINMRLGNVVVLSPSLSRAVWPS